MQKFSCLLLLFICFGRMYSSDHSHTNQLLNERNSLLKEQELILTQAQTCVLLLNSMQIAEEQKREVTALLKQTTSQLLENNKKMNR